jgi:FlaG/FlaF family flagellin (archaellin)
MKKLNYVSSMLVMIAIACSLAASTATAASSTSARSTDNGRLVVSRSADFGTVQAVHLFVDGVAVEDLGVNQTYATALPAGKHVLAISTTPTPYGDATTKRHLNIKPGRTYAFTAIWKDPEHASLKKS